MTAGQTVAGLRGTTVERAGKPVLSIEALDFRRGEVLAIIGPNGAGKSTLLRILGLLERPSRGDVLFDGRPVSGNHLTYRRRIAAVFQEPLLLDTTVEANVRSGMRMRGVPRSEQELRLAEWLRRFGIAHLARRSARTLSGGEAQRTSLARAFVLEPELLLLDEPFAALDAAARQTLIEDLDALLTERSGATVFVTHDRSEALRLGDRLAVLIGGRIRQTGTPSEVFGSPVDEEVAAFVGVETIVAGRVAAAKDGLISITAAGTAIEAVGEFDTGSDVLVCLRPEDIVLSPAGDSAGAMSARNHLQATVTRLLPFGPYLRAELDAGFPAVAFVTRQSLEDLAIAPGSSVIASFKASAVHLIPHRGG